MAQNSHNDERWNKQLEYMWELEKNKNNNNEIKEILDNLYRYKTENDEMKYQPEDILTIEDVWLLLDYITNLQEENERLKEITEINNDEEYIYTYEELQDKVLKLQKENKRLNKQYDLMEQSLDEKQAVIDKAIELIHKAMLDSEIIGNGTLNLNDLLNILGGDKNE